MASILSRRTLGDAYATALETYLTSPEEEALTNAYELGRQALRDGFGPLDVVALHESALEVAPGLAFESGTPAFVRATAFLLESLSPFEMTYRQFLESNVALRGVNEALEDQSRRTARQIHDGAGQILFTLQLAVAELMKSSPRRLQPQFDQVMRLTDHLDQQLRGLSRDLYPVALDDLGLNAAVRHLLQGVAAHAGLQVSFHSSVRDSLPARIAITLYRAIHEAVANVARHARATEVQVSLARDAEGIECTVKDNGIGIVGDDTHARGLGIRGIRDRLKGLQGELVLKSEPGSGTTLVVFIPVAFDTKGDGN